MRPSDPEPGIVELRLLRHVAALTSSTLVSDEKGVMVLRSIAELAQSLGVSARACQIALNELVRRDQLQARLHPGDLYELRLLPSEERPHTSS